MGLFFVDVSAGSPLRSLGTLRNISAIYAHPDNYRIRV